MPEMISRTFFCNQWKKKGLHCKCSF